MSFLIVCKNKEDPIKNKGARVVTTFSLIFRHFRAANSEVSYGILLKLKLIRAFIVGLVTFKNEEDPCKNEVTIKFSQHFSHYKSMGIFKTLQSS